MVELKSVAVTIKEIREPGAAGYTNNVLMVPYKLAQDRIDEAYASQKLVLKENETLCKEIGPLRGRVEWLEKQLKLEQPNVGGTCHR